MRRNVLGLLSLLVFVLALLAVNKVLGELAWADVRREIGLLSPASILISMAAAGASYGLLTVFDLIAVRYGDHNIPLGSVARTAFIANALGHNLGMAAITGGSVRARAYADHGLDAVAIGQIIANASLGFLLGAMFWLGVALCWEADFAALTLPASAGALRICGVLLLIALALGFVPLARGRRSFLMFGKAVAIPAWHDGLIMLGASVLELGCAAGALYALLPETAGIHFLGFAGLYVIAITAGVISTVPGGLGVFEAALLLMLPSVSPQALLGSILVYRALYYLVPLAIALLLLGASGAYRHTHALRQNVVSVWRWSDTLVAPTFSVLIFAVGATLVITGSLPLNLGSEDALAQTVGLPILELSHLSASALGVVLLILASGLYQRIRLAWWLCICGLALASLLVLVTGLRWPLALAALLLMLPLWSARRRFYRGTSLLAATRGNAWLRNSLLVIGASAWLGLVVHRNVAYENDLWWQFAFESDAPRMLRALLMSLLVLTAFGLIRLLWPRATGRAIASDNERERAAAIIARSPRADANLALLPDKLLLFAEGDAGVLMYQRSGPCLVAMGDPIGDDEVQRQLAWRFRELADRGGLATVFYQVSAANLPIYLDMGLSLTKLGEQAVVPLATFSLEGKKRGDLRRDHARAQREGARFAILSPDEVVAALPRLRAISDRWLDDKEAAEKGFSLGYFDDTYLSRFPCAVVRFEDEIIAFANLWPTADRSELSIDLMRYVDAGPHYVMDFLFVELMLWAKANGYREFSLGMAPLAGLSGHELAPMWHKFGVFATRHGSHFYNFSGLRNYKNKFLPQWRPRYLVCPGGLRMPLIMFHVSRLISGGTLQLLGRP